MRIRLARITVSWVLIGVGVPLLLRAELGVAPFDVFNTGIADALGGSFGTWYVVNSLVFYAIGTMLGTRPGPASIVGTFAIGPLINLFLDIVPTTELIVARIGLLTGGIAILAVGICMIITTELGAGPSEVVMLGLVDRGLDLVPARWLADGVPLLVGALLGGAFGVGTVVFTLVMAPLVKVGLRWLHYEPSATRTAALALVAE